MQEKQNTGVDTWGMLPILGLGFMGIMELFLPWISVSALKYTDMETQYPLWKLRECIRNFIQSIGISGTKLHMSVPSDHEMEIIWKIDMGIRMATIVLVFLFIVTAILAYKRRGKSIRYVRFTMSLAMIFPMMMFAIVLFTNLFLNQEMGRESNFVNLTIHSYVRLTAYPYAQMMVSGLLLSFARRLLDTETEEKKETVRVVRKDKRIGMRTKVATILILFIIPFFIFFGIFFLDNKSDTFVSLCIIMTAMIPFFMVFEDRRPQAREVLLIAVMAGIAVVGRMAFFMIPQFKPVSAIIIITGAGLGAEAGFLTGAVAGFVSNFFFGQGPWTPWQMFAFGVIGFLSGLLFGKQKKKNRIVLSIYGGIATLVIYGFIMDTSSITFLTTGMGWEKLKAVYLTGLPFNIIHGVSTILFLFFLTEPFIGKLNRIKKKYGILEV